MSDIDRYEAIVNQQTKQQQELLMVVSTLASKVDALVVTTDNTLSYHKETINTLTTQSEENEINIHMLQVQAAKNDEKFINLESKVGEIKVALEKKNDTKKNIINTIIIGVVVSVLVSGINYFFKGSVVA